MWNPLLEKEHLLQIVTLKQEFKKKKKNQCLQDQGRIHDLPSLLKYPLSQPWKGRVIEQPFLPVPFLYLVAGAHETPQRDCVPGPWL